MDDQLLFPEKGRKRVDIEQLGRSVQFELREIRQLLARFNSMHAGNMERYANTAYPIKQVEEDIKPFESILNKWDKSLLYRGNIIDRIRGIQQPLFDALLRLLGKA